MTAPASSLATPESWDLVADDYAAITAPFFRNYAAAALHEANLKPGAKLLDVATGPGTLSLLAATQGYAVTAVDFAPSMIAKLELLALRQNLRVQGQVADGMALPFASESFDAAFSMFGLIFFPDRIQGFRELHRTLKPGGVAVVSSWQPMERFEMLRDIFAALHDLLPNMPFGSGKAPLGEPEEIQAEMAEAGFIEVRTQTVSASAQAPSLDEAWEFMYRGSAPFALLRRNIGEDQWVRVEQGIKKNLLEKYGPGPQTLTMVANLGIGYRPAGAR
jgi:SAM-dependent methyltransferase